MSNADGTAIRFVKPTEGRTVMPLLCPMCGSGEVNVGQAFAFDESKSGDNGILSGAHFQCAECKAHLTVRVERHRVSIRWRDAS